MMATVTMTLGLGMRLQMHCASFYTLGSTTLDLLIRPLRKSICSNSTCKLCMNTCIHNISIYLSALVQVAAIKGALVQVAAIISALVQLGCYH